MIKNNNQHLLIELLTEELPPKDLKNISEEFTFILYKNLNKEGFLLDRDYISYATPRRIAALYFNILHKTNEHVTKEKLMPLKLGIDCDGKITDLLSKKLKKQFNIDGIDIKDLCIENNGKEQYLFLIKRQQGKYIENNLQQIITDSLNKLHIPKIMRYQLSDGITTVKFIRPVRNILLMLEDNVVNVKILGLNSNCHTFGHRLMSDNKVLKIDSAKNYEKILEKEGNIIPSFDKRKSIIKEKLIKKANFISAHISNSMETEQLLNEVTSLVEYPEVYIGEFDEDFLKLPPECLILTMQLNQKYFPLFSDANSALINKFLIVSNLSTNDEKNIISGNQRVIRPRLSDAEFFYEQDLKTPLIDMVSRLDKIVYHNQLGSQLDRTHRIKFIAKNIANILGANMFLVEQAATFLKADLSSNMVNEFPELQGIIGSYYALKKGMRKEIVEALKMQYRNKFDSIINQNNIISAIMFISDRIETLLGLFSVNLKPNGEKDPFGLRRAALGIISIYENIMPLSSDQNKKLSLNSLLQESANIFDNIDPSVVKEVSAFIYDKYKNQLFLKFDKNIVDAVISVYPPINQVVLRINALNDFIKLEKSKELFILNKRVVNFVKHFTENNYCINSKLLDNIFEINLISKVEFISSLLNDHLEKENFFNYWESILLIKDEINGFLDNVIILNDDIEKRNNRIAIMHRLYTMINLIANISKL